MRKVVPYRTVSGAKNALDNGGRIYNLLSRAKDGRITGGELTKAAGVILANARAIVFLHMALAGLNDQERSEVLAMLDRPLSRRYLAHAPRRLPPFAISEQGKAGEAVVVIGSPKFARQVEHQSKTYIAASDGFLRRATIREYYDLYDLSSPQYPSKTSPALVLKAGSRRPSKRPARFGGIVRALNLLGNMGTTTTGLYLEPLYFTPLD